MKASLDTIAWAGRDEAGACGEDGCQGRDRLGSSGDPCRKFSMWRFQKQVGAFFRSTHDKDHGILGSILNPPVYVNLHDMD